MNKPPIYVSVVLGILVIIAGIIIAHLINDKGELNVEIEQSKGRIQVYQQQIAKSDSIQKILKQAIKDDSIKISKTKDNIKIVEKWYSVEKTRVSKLPPDSAVAYIKRRLNRK